MKKILLISTFFQDKTQYIQIQIADTLFELGYEVTVIASNKSLIEDKIVNDKKPYEIHRIDKYIRITDTFYPIEKKRIEIHKFDPDIAILIYPGFGLPFFLLKYIPPRTKIISIFGDIHQHAQLKLGNKLIKQFIKYSWYKTIIKRSVIVGGVTDQTINILRNVPKLKKVLDSKLKRIELGFNSKNYFLCSEVREKIRSKLGYTNNTIVLITITRIVQHKPVDKWLVPIFNALEKNNRLKYILAGFNESEFSSQIKKAIRESKYSQRIKLYDYVETQFMNTLFNCADYGVWFSSASIAIQQAMGTGLPVFLMCQETLGHLLDEGCNGVYYKDYNDLTLKLIALKQKLNRSNIAQMNHKFSYHKILEEILKSV